MVTIIRSYSKFYGRTDLSRNFTGRRNGAAFTGRSRDGDSSNILLKRSRNCVWFFYICKGVLIVCKGNGFVVSQNLFYMVAFFRSDCKYSGVAVCYKNITGWGNGTAFTGRSLDCVGSDFIYGFQFHIFFGHGKSGGFFCIVF